MSAQPSDHKEQPANREQASDTGIEDRIAPKGEALRDIIAALKPYFYDQHLPPSPEATRAVVSAIEKYAAAALDAKDGIIQRLLAVSRADDERVTDAESAGKAIEEAIRTQQAQIETLRGHLVDAEGANDEAWAYADEIEAERDELRARAEHAEAALLQMREAWSQSWDCSRDPGHRIMNAAVEAVSGEDPA